jgi:hypothetical protein
MAEWMQKEQSIFQVEWEVICAKIVLQEYICQTNKIRLNFEFIFLIYPKNNLKLKLMNLMIKSN